MSRDETYIYINVCRYIGTMRNLDEDLHRVNHCCVRLFKISLGTYFYRLDQSLGFDLTLKIMKYLRTVEISCTSLYLYTYAYINRAYSRLTIHVGHKL